MARLTGMKTYTIIQPLAVTKAQAVTMLGSGKTLKRMAAAGWLVIVQKGSPGRRMLIDLDSLNQAYQRWKHGELPPLTPDENEKTLFLRS